MAVPRPPTIVIFQPFTTKVVIGCAHYVDDEDQTDFEYRVNRVDTGSLVVQAATGTAVRRVVVTGLALIPGKQYRVRCRWESASGFSGWSTNTFATVPSELDLEPLPTFSEPSSGGSLTIAPETVIALADTRPSTDYDMEAGGFWRRLRTTRDRGAVAVRWIVDDTDAATLLAFLRARADAGESFDATFAQPDDALGGGRLWAVDGASIETTLLPSRPNGDRVRAVSATLVEVFQSGRWTVGVTAIGSADRIG